MRKTAIVGTFLVAVLLAGGFASCGSSRKAGGGGRGSPGAGGAASDGPDSAMLLVEAMGGTGRVDVTTGSVTVQ
jgi:hypothetical protein